MRFTFVILLFCCLGADAQMIIKAHANYVPFAAGVTPLLDTYTGAAAAYSLRKLRTAYTGSAIRVRRSNDNTEQDIGFTSSGDLDTSSLKTFVGANNGFVTTWYAQDGSVNINATQATAANQPMIISSGVIYRINGKPSIYFDGGDALAITTTTALSFLHKSGESFCSIVVQPSTVSGATGNRYMMGNARNAGEPGIQYFFSSDQIVHNVYAGGSVTVISNTTAGGYTNPTNSLYNITIYTNVSASASSRSTIEKNNGSAVNNNAATGTASAGNAFRNMQIGQAGNGGSWLTGYISEIIIWNSGQQSNKSGIASNINSYFSIY
jgi:hypothetical protein